MIKWPEPFLVRHEDVCGDEVGPPTPCYTETQLKQAVRDALTLTIQRLNGNTYNLTKAECVEEIRALIKEVDACVK